MENHLFLSGEIIGTRVFIHWKEYLCTIWLVSTTNAQQKSLEWDVMEKQEASFSPPFTSSWPHQKLLPSSFTLTQFDRPTNAHTLALQSFSTVQCEPQGTAPSCWKMLLPAHLCVCAWGSMCVFPCVYMCVWVYTCARENTFSCFTSNGHAETCVSHTAVFPPQLRSKDGSPNQKNIGDISPKILF